MEVPSSNLGGGTKFLVMNQQQLILQVSQETYRLRQIIDSCKTKDQLLNARQLCNNVTLKWINMSDFLSSNIDVSLRI